MSLAVISLERILKEEIALYDEVLRLEKQKEEIIIEKNGSELESLSLLQEECLAQISAFEERRLDVVFTYKQDMHLDNVDPEMSFSQIVKLMDEDSALHLTELSVELKHLLLELKSVKEVNEQLLNDNMDFFNTLIVGLRQETESKKHYDAKGNIKHNSSQAVLFSQSV